jgi:hypothetical protein
MLQTLSLTVKIVTMSIQKRLTNGNNKSIMESYPPRGVQGTRTAHVLL